MFESIEYICPLVKEKENKKKYIKKLKSISQTTKIFMECKKRLDLTLVVSIFPFKWHRHDIGCVWKKMS